MKKIIITLAFFNLLLFACTYNKEELTVVPVDPNVPIITYTNAVESIIAANCVTCHSPASLNGIGQVPFLTTFDELKTQVNNGRIEARAINNVPSAMPPGAPLSQDIKNTLQDWINQGALE